MRAFTATVMLLAASSAVGDDKLAVAPQYLANLAHPPGESIDLAAKFLAERQGAWRGSTENAIVLNGWEWQIGTGTGAGNIAGVVALGLLDAWEATGRGEYLEAARSRAEVSLAALRRGEDLYAADIELVARVARSAGSLEEEELANQALERRLANAGGPEGEVKRIVGLRAGYPDLAGYDVALVAEAAVSLGKLDVARALVNETMRRRKAWLVHGGSTFGIISQGALLHLASELGLAQASRDLAVSLLAQQLEDGSWHARETQATSYATRGLAAFGKALNDGGARKAAARGREWLRLTQLTNGAWADFNDYLPEPFVGDVYAPATAEALRAVVSVNEG